MFEWVTIEEMKRSCSRLEARVRTLEAVVTILVGKVDPDRAAEADALLAKHAEELSRG